MFENKEEKERLILVGIGEESSLDELEELIYTAKATVVGRMLQNREMVHPGTYLGSGKLQELRELIEELDATGIVCDDELSPAQIRNMEDVLQIKILDRTLVILDIFAARANTHEGKIQVELAQLKYRATRLVGMRRSLSRLGGGIGTRGPGEKKLEMDRRLIHNRISQLKAELKEVMTHREITRGRRDKNKIPVIALVGYTNAGKSTLFNYLTGAGVLEEDKLFATLDPAVRQVELEEGQKILLTDTVGFIHKLPHHLVEAFRSTLEEAKYADIILHVVDTTSPQMEMHMHVVYETLAELGVVDKPILTVFNKIDLLEQPQVLKDLKAKKTFQISAKTGRGVDALLAGINEELTKNQVYVEKLFPYERVGEIQVIRQYGQLLSEEYTEDGVVVTAYVPIEIYNKYNI
ncbi:GTP-binding protein HflX [Lachnospiraceae bacterium TWA4]|nr:GTP-binding protein HflX [Lachnospiraceae bacterium TWA4]